MDRELLYYSVHWSAELLKPGLLLGLDEVLGKPVRLLLRLGQVVGNHVPIFRCRLRARLTYGGDRRLGLQQMTLLDTELLLLLNQKLEHLEITELRAQLLL